MREKKPDTALIAGPERDDLFQSSWVELERSHEYADDTLYSTARLEAKGRYWMSQLHNPDRSARGLREVAVILDRITLEVALRNGADIRVLESLLEPQAS